VTGTETIRQILVPEHNLPIVVASAVLRTGSLFDPEGMEGLAYITGQMLTRGAGGMSREEIAEALDQIGSSLGVSVSRDIISVGGDALSRYLDRFQGLVTRIMTEPTFPQDELERLKGQVIDDLLEVRENDAALGQRAFLLALFEGHPYGRLLKGRESSISRIAQADVKTFYEDRFHQHDALFAAAGDVTAERLDAFTAETAGRLPSLGADLPDVPSIATGEGYAIHLVDKPERSQTQVFLGHDSVTIHHPDYLPLMVAQTIFGGTFTSRMSAEIREKRGLSYGAYSYLTADRWLGTFMMRFYPAVKDTIETLDLCDTLFRAFVEDGATEEEVSFAKRYLVHTHVFSLETAERRLQEQVSCILHGHTEDWLTGYTARIEALSIDDVNGAIRRHLKPDRLIAGVVATARELSGPLERWGRVTSMSTRSYRDI
jgi:zinc protease